MDEGWPIILEQTVRTRRLVIFQFSYEEWSRLRESSRGLNQFTIARPHEYLDKLETPTACIVLGEDGSGTEARFGVVSSRSPVSTLESRVKVRRAQRIQPSSKAGLFRIVTEKSHAKRLQDRLASAMSIVVLRFIKRDGALRNAAITIPIDHFERLREDPACRGPRGGFRISFERLAGRYLRQSAFLDLIRSGYIGAHEETTIHLKTLVEAVVRHDRAAVAAVQSRRSDDVADVEAFGHDEFEI